MLSLRNNFANNCNLFKKQRGRFFTCTFTCGSILLIGGSQRNVGISRMVAFGFPPYVNQSPLSPSCLYRYRKTMNIRLKGGGEWGGAGIFQGIFLGTGLNVTLFSKP